MTQGPATRRESLQAAVTVGRVLAQVLARLSALGLRFERQDARLATRMAFGMFDTDASFRRAGRYPQHVLAHSVPGCALL